MTTEETRKLNEVYEFMQQLKSASTIPVAVDQAFRDRLSKLTGLSTSAKAANSENKTVQEAGSTTYGVLDEPSGFLQVQISGTTYYLPYYT